MVLKEKEYIEYLLSKLKLNRASSQYDLLILKEVCNELEENCNDYKFGERNKFSLLCCEYINNLLSDPKLKISFKVKSLDCIKQIIKRFKRMHYTYETIVMIMKEAKTIEKKSGF